MRARPILKSGQYLGNINKSIIIDGAIVSRTNYKIEQQPMWHCHENLHISFVFQPSKSETRHREIFTKKEGSILFYHSEEMHRYSISENSVYSSNIEIPASFLNKYELSEDEIYRNIQKKADAKSTILLLQHELMQKEEQLQSVLLPILLNLVSNPASIYDTKPNWVKHLEELLHDNWNEMYSLDDLSNILGVHPITISKNFRNYFNTTLGEYRRRIKIEKSLELIKTSDMNLSEIAHFCNFSDQSHLIRNFKKYTGFLPKHFKKF